MAKRTSTSLNSSYNYQQHMAGLKTAIDQIVTASQKFSSIVANIEQRQKQHIKLLGSGQKLGGKSSKMNGITTELKTANKYLKDGLVYEELQTEELENQTKELKNANQQLRDGLSYQQRQTGELENISKMLKDQFDLEQKQTEELKKQNDETQEREKLEKKVQDRRQANLNTATAAAKALGGWAKAAGKEWLGNEEVISKLNAHFGGSQKQIDWYKNTVYEASRKTLNLYGQGPKELTEMQTSFSETLGRNIKITDQGFQRFAALSNIIGADGVNELISKSEEFGMSNQAVYSNIEKNLKDIQKNGLSLNKVINDTGKNMDYLNRFTFKDGITGLSRMTIESNKFRLNMAEIANLANKVSSPEGAIQTAAKLQVLGGAFAKIADPLQMLHEGINDFEGLGKRIIAAGADSMKFDRKTGVIDYRNGYERMRAMSGAEAMGISFDEFNRTTRTAAKRREIERETGFKGIPDNMKDLVASVAEFNTKSQTWEVNVNGQAKAITAVGEADRKYLIEEGKELHSIAQSVMGIEKKLDIWWNKNLKNEAGRAAQGVATAWDINGKANWLNEASANNPMLNAGLAGLGKTLAFAGSLVASVYGSNMLKNLVKYGTLRAPKVPIAAVSAAGAPAAVPVASGTRNTIKTLLKAGVPKSAIRNLSRFGTTFKPTTGGLLKGGALGLGATGVSWARNAIIDDNKSWKDDLMMGKGGVADTGLAMGQGALAGAGWGSVLGPVGAGVGALVGAVSTFAEKMLKMSNSDNPKAQLRARSIAENQQKMEVSSTDDILRNISDSAFGIKMMLEKRYGKATEAKKGLVESAFSWFNKTVLGTKVNDAVITKGQVIPVDSEDDILAAKNGGVVSRVLPNPNNYRNGYERTRSQVDFGKISGTIKLESANGMNADITKQILKDPNFIRTITPLIFQEANARDNISYKGNMNREALKR